MRISPAHLNDDAEAPRFAGDPSQPDQRPIWRRNREEDVLLVPGEPGRVWVRASSMALDGSSRAPITDARSLAVGGAGRSEPGWTGQARWPTVLPRKMLVDRTPSPQSPIQSPGCCSWSFCPSSLVWVGKERSAASSQTLSTVELAGLVAAGPTPAPWGEVGLPVG